MERQLNGRMLCRTLDIVQHGFHDVPIAICKLFGGLTHDHNLFSSIDVVN